METQQNETSLAQDDLAMLEQLHTDVTQIRESLAQIIIGQDQVVTELLTSVFARGHCILEGVPGLAKTLLISTLADLFDTQFSRIQFTPDLMPTDITGTEIIHEDKATGAREFRFMPGPVFANLLLADEINRTPPKTQAALLEAMQEGHVTVGGKRHDLPRPFFVLATQNPIDQEGTYPLPEAQQDRFMFKVLLDYPDYEDEFKVGQMTTVDRELSIEPVLHGEDLVRYQSLIRRIPVADHVIHYALNLVRATRVDKDYASEHIKPWLNWGAGPRALQFLLLGGKVNAAFAGRKHVTSDDIKAVAKPVLRHRLVTNFSADSEGITSDHLIEKLLDSIDPAGVIPEEVQAAFAS